MFLSAAEIEREIDKGDLVIESYNGDLLKPASYVLRLADEWREQISSPNTVRVWENGVGNNLYAPISKRPTQIIDPGITILGRTLEKLSLPNYLGAHLATTSHIARFGLTVHLGSTMVSPGFGQGLPTPLTLELTSFSGSSLLLDSGLPICHLCFFRISNVKESSSLQRSIYEGLKQPEVPKLYEEFHSILTISYETHDGKSSDE